MTQQSTSSANTDGLGPRTGRGERTRRRLLEAAERVFGEHGYHEASIVKITEAAGVAQGTLYLYFRTKAELFEELVDDLNGRVRRAMAERAAAASDRLDAERLGLIGFLEFTAHHPALYRIIQQAEFVSPVAMQRHYQRIAAAYADGLKAAMDRGEIVAADPEAIAWSLMGVGEMVGMRWILWGKNGDVPETEVAHVPDEIVEEVISFISRGLTNPALPSR
jgi:AcrR family transcriptional regulator